jgi:hypothetical protein
VNDVDCVRVDCDVEATLCEQHTNLIP